MVLEERIDNIGKKPKVQRRKKKGDDDVDVSSSFQRSTASCPYSIVRGLSEQIVDSYHDEVCARIRDRMIIAAERDKASNDAKTPATAKLAMLDEVMGVLRKSVLTHCSSLPA